MSDMDDWTERDERGGADAELFARLRAAWEEADPVPEDLVDRLVAAVAVADISREYALLTLVEEAELSDVRTSTEAPDSTVAGTATLQFSDGVISVLLHISATSGGARRIDGWVTGEALVVRLTPDDEAWSTEPVESRFAFDEVPSGQATLRLVVRNPYAGGGLREFMTPPFML